MPKEDIIKVMQIYNDTLNTLDNILIGQKDVKKAVASSLLCTRNSKVLLMGEPGVGKTTLAKSLTASFNSERISVTSDLIPSEIIDQLKNNLKLEFLYIDEFNRASSKVHSAFIELFEEKQLSVNGIKYPFDDFYVFATENTADITGIFNVSQAMYDRFDMNIPFNMLSDEDKRQLLFGKTEFNPLKIDTEKIRFAINQVENFNLNKDDEDLLMQIFNIIDSLIYKGENLFFGSNIRGHRYAIKIAKLNALADGRNYILPRDLADFLIFLYQHRINQNIINQNTARDILENTKNDILKLKRKK